MRCTRPICAIAVAAVLTISPRARGEDAAPRETWHVLESGGTRFGSIHTATRRQEDGTQHVVRESRTLVDLLGQRQELSERLECKLTATGQPLELHSESHTQSGAVVADGAVQDGHFVVTIKRGDSSFERRLPLTEEPILAICLSDALARAGRPTAPLKLTLLDSDSWSLVQTSAERLDDAEGKARWKIAGSATESGTWLLASDGAIERVEMGANRTLRRADQGACAKLTHLTFSNSELLVFPISQNIPFPERLKSVTVKLSWRDLPLARLNLEDSHQRIVSSNSSDDKREAVLRLERPAPIERSPALGTADDSMSAYLSESTYIEPHNAAIREQARKWTAGCQTNLEAIRKLSHEVSAYLQGGELIAETLSGPEVLACRKGKCTEFTTLLASLARSVGVPTRVALGMRLSGGRWMGHMWCEAWVGQWIPIDATADEVGGSPALLKLTHSDTVQGTQGVRWAMTRSLELEIVDFQRDDHAAQNLTTGIVRQTYTNADFACRISAPNADDKLVDQSTGGVVNIQIKLPQEFKHGEPLIHFVAFSLPSPLDPSVVTGARKLRFASTYQQFEVLADEIRKGGPGNARVFAFRRQDPKSPELKFKTTEVVWTDGRSGYLMNLIAEESTHDTVFKQFEAAVASFESLRGADK